MSDADPRVNDALKMFEFFESKGFQDKQQMMTLVTWLTPVLFALIAYCWTQFVSALIAPHHWTEVTSGWMPLAAGLAAVFVSWYAKFVIREFAIHAELNYRKADHSRALLPKGEVANLLKFPPQTDARTWFDRAIQKERERLGRAPELARAQPHGKPACHVGKVFLVLSLGARCVLWLSVSTVLLASAFVVVGIPRVIAQSYHSAEVTGSFTAPGNPKRGRSVTLLAINDVYRIGGVDRGRRGGLARVRTLRRELEADDRDLIVLHAGDVIFPSLLSTMYDGEQMIDALNTLDGQPFSFDDRLFVTFGNHEFDKRKLGQASILAGRVKESQFYWLRSNINFATDEGGQPLVRGSNVIDSRIIDANGVKVGLFGLTTNIASADYVLAFEDPKETARRFSRELRTAGAELVIAVTHLALDEDKEILATLGSAGPDLIIGGHEHTQEHEVVDGRWVLKADADAVSAVAVRIWLRPGETPAVEYTYKELAGDRPLPDPDVNRVVQRWRTHHAALFCARDQKPPECLDEEISTAAVRLVASEERIRSCETNLGNWIADQMRLAFPGAQAAFMNAGSLRLNQDLPAGPIYRRDLEELVQYDNKLRLIEIDGATLDQVANNAVAGWPGNGRWLQISGFTFRHERSGLKDAAIGLALLGKNGERVELRSEDRVRAVTTDFLLDPEMGNQDGYTMLSQRHVVPDSTADMTLKGVIREALVHAGDAGISPKVEGRIVQAKRRPCAEEPPTPDLSAETPGSAFVPVNNGADKMTANLDLSAILGATVWPLVILIGLLVYRNSIRAMAAGLTGRASKLEFAGFSLQLAVAKPFVPEWSGSPGALDLRHTATAIQVSDSTRRTFLAQLTEEGTGDYAQVNLGAGGEWLTSRLFIMAIVFARMKGIKCFVFVETAGGVRNRFVGWAEPQTIRWALARRYPWLEQAYAEAYSAVITHPQQNGVIVSSQGKLGSQDPVREPAVELLTGFLQRVQSPPGPPPITPDLDWVPIEPATNTQEHARWISSELLEQILGTDLVTSTVRSADIKSQSITEQLKIFGSLPGRFLAVTEEDRRFEYLIDKTVILEAVAGRLSSEVDGRA